MEVNLFHFLVDTFQVLGFLGQDTGVLKLDKITQVYAMLGHS
jgi:hypothetical protein